jgi:hypothetical protein
MYTEILLDKPRRLRFDIAAVRDLEAALGQPLGLIWQQLGQMGINALCLALWAGLKHEDRALTQNLTVKIVERYVANGGKLKPIISAVTEAFEASDVFKSLEEELGNVAPEPAATTESR